MSTLAHMQMMHGARRPNMSRVLSSKMHQNSISHLQSSYTLPGCLLHITPELAKLVGKDVMIMFLWEDR